MKYQISIESLNESIQKWDSSIKERDVLGILALEDVFKLTNIE